MHRRHPPKLQLLSTITQTAGNHVGWTAQKGWLGFPQVQLLITIQSHSINIYPPAPQPTGEGTQDCLCCYNYSWKAVQELLPLFPGMNWKSLCSALITNKNELKMVSAHSLFWKSNKQHFDISTQIQGWQCQQIYLSAQRELTGEKFFLPSLLNPAFVMESALTEGKTT